MAVWGHIFMAKLTKYGNHPHLTGALIHIDGAS